MTSRPKVAAFAIAALLVIAGAADRPAYGQTGADPAAPEPVLGPEGQELTDAECAALNGATAPIQRIARLPGAMSVRNLELTYFGKPLYELTARDFEYLKILKPFCEGTPSAVDAVIIEKLEQKVTEARATRDRAVQWINETTARLDSLPPSPQAIREVHNVWTEMENRSLEMLSSDQAYLSDYLTKRRDALYASKQSRSRVLVSPFDPGPTVPPDGRE